MNEKRQRQTDSDAHANRFLDFYGTFFVYARARVVDYMMDRSRHARGISFFIRMNNFRFLYFLDKVFYIFEMKKYICRVVEFFFGGRCFFSYKKRKKDLACCGCENGIVWMNEICRKKTVIRRKCVELGL